MRFLEFSDPHLTRAAEFGRPTEDGLNEYLQLVVKSFDFVREIAEREKPDVLVCGGDVWDARDFIDTIALNVGYQVFSKLTALPIPHKIVVVGNHDYWSIEHGIYTLRFLRDQGWYVFDEPSIADFGGVAVMGLPYRDQYDLVHLKDMIATQPDVVFAHCDVVGAKYRAPKHENDTKAFSTHGLEPALFEGIQVFNGHYHHPSQVSPTWLNVGSLTSRSFHDKDSDPRGVVLYDTETREITRYANPFARKYTEFRIEDERDLELLFDEDHSETYAKLYYDPALIEQVTAAKELFAGTRLLPIVKRQRTFEEKENTYDFRFSLEDNLEAYVRANHAEDAEALLPLALELFAAASQDYEADNSRLPLDFQSVTIHNFQSIGHVEVDLATPGLRSLQGVNDDNPDVESNGSGKSSFLEAIYWCFTGKSLRGYKKKEVIKWGATYTRVSTRFLSGETLYTVVRVQGKDPIYPSGLHLFAGEENIGARLKTDTETKLQEILGRSHKSLQHVSFLHSSLASRYSALNSDQRARLLEEILDVKPYDIARKLAKSRRSSVSTQLATVRGSLATLLRKREENQNRLNELDRELKEYDATSEETVAKQKATLVQLEDGIQQLLGEQQQIRTILKELKDDQDAIDTKRVALIEPIRAATVQQTMTHAELVQASTTRERHANLVFKQLCPTCEEPVKQSKHQQTLNTIDVQIQQFRATLDAATKELERLQSRSRKLDEKFREKGNLRETYQQKFSAIESSIRQKERLRETIAAALAQHEADRSKLVAAYEERARDLESLLPEVTKSLDQEEMLEEQERLLGILQDEVFDETGVRQSLLATVAVPYLNARIPEYGEHLWGGRSLEIDPADLEFRFYGDTTYVGASSGEKRRIDLAVQFALNDLAAATGRSRINFLAVDEVLDTLDRPGIAAVVRVLRQKAADMSIFLVSHTQTAASLIPNHLVFYKKNGTTYLVEERSDVQVLEG